MVKSSDEFVTGDGRVVTVKHITEVYRNVNNLLTPSSANIQRLSDSQYSITGLFSTLNCDTLENVKTSKVYSLTTSVKPGEGRCIESVRCVSGSQSYTDLATVSSKNGRFLARLRAPTSGCGTNSDASGKKQLLEIWDRSRLIKTIDTSEVDLHGMICTDPAFGTIEWCPFGNQDKLLYVCQKKQTKSANFFKQESSGSQPNDIGQEYDRKESWGETLEEIDHTILAILDLSKDLAITTIDVPGFSLGDSQWLDGGNKILSVAWSENPKRLGLVYCNNRPSKLIIHDHTQSPPKEVACPTEVDKCFHSPRVDCSGLRYIYLKNEAFGTHKHSSELHLYDIRTNKDVHLIDKASGDQRLFIESLPRNCFSNDDKHVLFVKSDYITHNMCLFDLDNSVLTNVKFPTTGLQVCDFQDNIILAKGSEINETPAFFAGILNNNSESSDRVTWNKIEESVHFDEIEYESQMIRTQDGSSFVSALMVRPNLHLLHRSIKQPGGETEKLIEDHKQLPTVVIAHGGPHSAFVSGWMPILAFYSRLGLRVLLINYRGSTGVSEEYVQSLCGKIGKQDVEDCMTAIRHFVQNKSIEPNKMIIMGGSHGGFLGCHLSCQQEFKFTSAVLSNPVVDVSANYWISDIPDWSSCESLGHKTFGFESVPSSQELGLMYECSPMFNAAKANVPTLMLLGAKDLRVPMFQGLRWVELLKARGIETQCRVYQDNHGLAKPEVLADRTVAAAIWILSHLLGRN